MIVLLVSAAEAQALIAGKPDQALRHYMTRELSLERLLPDDNLPNAVLLRGLELDVNKRNYIATVRMYATCEAADRAWEEMA